MSATPKKDCKALVSTPTVWAAHGVVLLALVAGSTIRASENQARKRSVAGRSMHAIAAVGKTKDWRPLRASQVPKVPEGHPRIYVRPTDLKIIRRKLKRSPFEAKWDKIRACAKGEGYGSRNATEPQRAICQAFVYLLKGDKGAGRKAIEATLPILTASTEGRGFDDPNHWAACVYDWCYPLLTSPEKAQYVKQFIRLAKAHHPGFPIEDDSQLRAIVGHSCEGWVMTGQLPDGIAIYDECRDLYKSASKFFFRRMVPARNFIYPGHWYHQGDSYTCTRMRSEAAVSWLFRAMGKEIFTPEMQFVPYHMLYCLRPDGQQIRRGDTFDDPGQQDGGKWLIPMLVGSYYNDPYLIAVSEGAANPRGRVWDTVMGDILEIIVRPVGLKSRPLKELPLTKYFPHPGGEMVARTGWQLGVESKDAVVFMRIGNYFFGNHQRQDAGTFQIYYRGALAIASGMYGSWRTPHWKYYHHQTLAHNGLLILDPDERSWHESFPVVDGGQRFPDYPHNLDQLLGHNKDKGGSYKVGEVTAHEFGPKAMAPEYSYISGDITSAYSSKVKAVTRSMVTLRHADPRYPCTVVVFDRIVSAKPSFKKTWLLHTIQSPTIEGRTIRVVRDEHEYKGKLVVQSLLPEAATMTKIGGLGKEYWVSQHNKNYPFTDKKKEKFRKAWEGGAWRIEVSPAKSGREHLFLHAMTVMDASTPDGTPARMIGTSAAVGVEVHGQAVLFSRTGRSLHSVTVELPAQTRVLVCDLKPGTWQVRKGTQKVGGRLPATKEGKCVHFRTTTSGEYLVVMVGATVPKVHQDAFWSKLRDAGRQALAKVALP